MSRTSFALGAGIATFVLAVATSVSAQPAITRPVTDETGVLSSATVAAIEQRLVAHHDAGHAQIALLFVYTTGRTPIEDYTLQVAERWGGGSREADDGALFVLALEDRAMRIEVGYGLESVISDAEAMRILDTLVPLLRAEHFDETAWTVSDALVSRTGGASQPMPEALVVAPDPRLARVPPADLPQRAEPSDTYAPAPRAHRAERPYVPAPSSWADLLFIALGLGGFGAVVVFMAIAMLRSSNATYTADGVAEYTPWSTLLRGFVRAALADGSSRSRRGGGDTSQHHRSAFGSSSSSSSSASHHSHHSSHRSHAPSYGSSSSYKSSGSSSYGGGGGGFGGGGASKRW